MDCSNNQLSTQVTEQDRPSYSTQARVESQQKEQSKLTRKRTREETDTLIEKRGCDEGLSWWTCLLLDVSQENTNPRPVRKFYNHHQ